MAEAQQQQDRLELEVLTRELNGRHYVYCYDFINIIGAGANQDEAVHEFKRQASVHLQLEPGYIGVVVRGTF